MCAPNGGLPILQTRIETLFVEFRQRKCQKVGMNVFFKRID